MSTDEIICCGQSIMPNIGEQIKSNTSDLYITKDEIYTVLGYHEIYRDCVYIVNDEGRKDYYSIGYFDKIIIDNKNNKDGVGEMNKRYLIIISSYCMKGGYVHNEIYKSDDVDNDTLEALKYHYNKNKPPYTINLEKGKIEIIDMRYIQYNKITDATTCINEHNNDVVLIEKNKLEQKKRKELARLKKKYEGVE